MHPDPVYPGDFATGQPLADGSFPEVLSPEARLELFGPWAEVMAKLKPRSNMEDARMTGVRNAAAAVIWPAREDGVRYDPLAFMFLAGNALVASHNWRMRNGYAQNAPLPDGCRCGIDFCDCDVNLVAVSNIDKE